MTDDRRVFGHSYTEKRRSRYGYTPNRRCSLTADDDDIQFIVFVVTLTSNTLGTEMKSVLSTQDPSETR